MVRALARRSISSLCSPHPRGDGPQFPYSVRINRVFSPPAWGWSARTPLQLAALLVLPTRVGMVRRLFFVTPMIAGSPHPRGDGPKREPRGDNCAAFSPPAWGWSDGYAHFAAIENVLPTRVGMVRGWSATGSALYCSPHPRGDGPKLNVTVSPGDPFSPPAWGWSAQSSRRNAVHWVLPTRVGMVRPPYSECRPSRCSPHPRGDGPLFSLVKRRDG